MPLSGTPKPPSPQDPELNRQPRQMTVAYSNADTRGSGTVRHISGARFFGDDGMFIGIGDAAAPFVGLEPMEVQILVLA